MGCAEYFCIKSSIVITVPLIKITFILCTLFLLLSLFCASFVVVSFAFFALLWKEKLQNDYITHNIYFTLRQTEIVQCSSFPSAEMHFDAIRTHTHTQTNKRADTHEHKQMEAAKKGWKETDQS